MEAHQIPKVFISYSWTSEEYKKYVVDLVYSLRKNGVDTIFDSYDLMPGDDKYVFMERIVNDPTVDKVPVDIRKKQIIVVAVWVMRQ